MKGRAELKVEGGKLVRADVSFDDEIQDVELHGDFFVYPEEALDRVEESQEGADPGADKATLSERIEHSLDDTVRLVGFGPEDVAEVVREAIEDEE